MYSRYSGKKGEASARCMIGRAMLVGVILLAAGCAPPQAEPELSGIPVPTFTLTPVPTHTLAPSPTLPESPTSRSSALRARYTNTPALERTQLAEARDAPANPTFTPDPNLTCPPTRPDVELQLPINESGWFMEFDLLLDYLNRGGSPDTAAQALADVRQGTIRSMDLTGDGMPELVLQLFEFLVYQCEQGQYVRGLRVGPNHIDSPPAAEIVDLNANGIPELVVTNMFWGAHDGTLSMYVYEWDGQGFASRLPESIDHPLGEQGVALVFGEAVHMYNGFVHFGDVDGNGTTEILLSGGGDEFFEDTVWEWNGREFALVEARQ